VWKGPGTGTRPAMTDRAHDELAADEVDALEGELIPDREEMAMMPLPDPFGGGGFATLPVEPPAES
jgi:hypothetical protein